MDGGMPLMNALANRKSSRDYDTRDIPVHILSNLLWAGFGVNRPQSGQRTAPSAHNVQDISIYVASARGLFRFDAKEHSLVAVLPDDIRALTVQNQANVAEAPIQLIYVSDYLRMSYPEEDKRQWSWAHSGLIAQNVYLFCASEGLASVVRTSFARLPLEERMGLGTSEHVTMTQAIGYPRQT
jgi:SagB-type dehydrogenase family enzyme